MSRFGGGNEMRVPRGMLKYFISFIGAYAFCFLIIALISLLSSGNADEIKWSIWFIGLIVLFYVFIGSLLWEFLFGLISFKSWRIGGFFYFLFGVIYGGITIAIVTLTIGEVLVMGWIVGMIMIGIAAFIFYAIRKKSVSV